MLVRELLLETNIYRIAPGKDTAGNTIWQVFKNGELKKEFHGPGATQFADDFVKAAKSKDAAKAAAKNADPRTKGHNRFKILGPAGKGKIEWVDVDSKNNKVVKTGTLKDWRENFKRSDLRGYNIQIADAKQAFKGKGWLARLTKNTGLSLLMIASYSAAVFEIIRDFDQEVKLNEASLKGNFVAQATGSKDKILKEANDQALVTFLARMGALGTGAVVGTLVSALTVAKTAQIARGIWLVQGRTPWWTNWIGWLTFAVTTGATIALEKYIEYYSQEIYKSIIGQFLLNPTIQKEMKISPDAIPAEYKKVDKVPTAIQKNIKKTVDATGKRNDKSNGKTAEQPKPKSRFASQSKLRQKVLNKSN